MQTCHVHFAHRICLKRPLSGEDPPQDVVDHGENQWSDLNLDVLKSCKLAIFVLK